jgi:uncharacterized OsmC-like protein
MTTETITRTCTNLDLATFNQTRQAVAADPKLGVGAFKTVTTWDDAARARTTARSFSIETDEPAPLGGTDRAVDPMELLLASLGTCLTIGWVTQAAKREVDFRSLAIEVEGDYDLRGYLAIGDEARPGFGGIRYTVRVDSDAAPDVLEEIRRAAEATSPMFDNVTAPTPVTGSVVGA